MADETKASSNISNSPPPPVEPPREDVKDQPEHEPRVRFADVDEESLAQLRDRNYAREKISRLIAESSAVCGAYNEEGYHYWLIPDSILKEDNIMGAIIADLHKESKIPLHKYKCESEITIPDELEDFFIGVWFGTFATENQKRSRGKKDIELGKAMSFALRVRSEFASNPKLGLSALVEDNFYFGNHPKETYQDGTPVKFALKNRWLSGIKGDRKAAEGLYSILLDFCNFTKLNTLDGDTYKKVLAYNLVGFDDIVKTQFRPVYVQKGKKPVLKGYRRPNQPKRSPVLSEGENELITSLFSPFWEPFTTLQKDWLDNVLHFSFTGITSQVKEEYNTRWEILSKYARLTTKRLQALRESKVIDDKTKKAGVTKTQLQDFFGKIEDPAVWLSNHLFKIIPDKHLRKAASGLRKGFPSSDQDARKLISSAVQMMYFNDKLSKKEAQIVDINYLDQFNDSLKNTITGISGISNKLGNLTSTVRSFGRHISKVPGQIQGIKNILQGLHTQIIQFEKDPCINDSIPYAIEAMGGKVLSYPEYVKYIFSEVDEQRMWLNMNTSSVENVMSTQPENIRKAYDTMRDALRQQYTVWEDLRKGLGY